jgi:8-oxo-dGTP pyrophosphatase MutT (NUDIX family)
MKEYKRAAGVAIIFGNSILLAKRAKEWKGEPVPYGGYWSVFGGMVEKGEAPFKAASREAMEEAEIDIPVYELKFIKTFHEDGLDFIFYVHEARELLTPKLNFEHTEYGWFDVQELDRFQEDIEPKIVECISLYIERRAAPEESS